MVEEKHQIIISAADDAIARRAAIAIWRPEVGIHRVPWGSPLAGLVAQEKFDAIVAEMPRSPSEISGFVRDVRRAGSPSRRLGFVALVSSQTADLAMDHLGLGINRAVPTDRIDEELETTVMELLEVAPRHRIGAPATVRPIDHPHEHEETACRIENASVSGILVRCRRELAPGSVIEFAVETPDGAPPIRGRATVCRTTRPGLDTVTGFGARLEDFVGADRGRYERMLLAQAG